MWIPLLICSYVAMQKDSFLLLMKSVREISETNMTILLQKEENYLL